MSPFAAQVGAGHTRKRPLPGIPYTLMLTLMMAVVKKEACHGHEIVGLLLSFL